MGVAILRMKLREGYGFGFDLGAMVLERPCREASAGKRTTRAGFCSLGQKCAKTVATRILYGRR